MVTNWWRWSQVDTSNGEPWARPDAVCLEMTVSVRRRQVSRVTSYQLPVADAGLVTSVDSDYKATWIQPPRPPDYAWLDMSGSDCDCNWTLNWSGSSFVGHSHGFYSGEDGETTTFAGSSPRPKGVQRCLFCIAFMAIFISTFIFVFIFDCHLLETCPSWPVWVSN